MENKVCHRYHLVDESPWSFLVSTASLFLTLGAVLFFYFFVQGLDLISDNGFSYCVVSFISLAKKVKPKVFYLGGSVLTNQAYNYYNRNYTFRPIGIGNAKWNPDNYSKSAQGFISKFLDHLNNCDKDSAYDVMYAVMGNKEGIFTQSYGKATSVINNMIYSYNKKNPTNQITESEFLDRYGFNYSITDLSFINSTNRGTVFTNITEVLAPKIVMSQNNNLIVERCFFINDKENLSFQKNPEYTIGIFVRNIISNEITLIVYDSDLKLTDPLSFCQKLKDLSKSQADVYEKSILGMNVIMMASHDDQNSDIIFSSENKEILIKYLKFLSKEYPSHFKNIESSDYYNNFVRTGEISYLNKSDLPIFRIYRPSEFYKLPHFQKKFEETPTYILLTNSVIERKNVKKSISPLIEEIIDDNNS